MQLALAFKWIWNNFLKIATVIVVVIALIAVNHTFFHWHLWGNSVKSTISASGPAEVTQIVPIVLDCRAKIDAQVPIEGKRRYQLY